jgi:hypothetical protein
MYNCDKFISSNIDKPSGFLTAVIDGQPYTVTAFHSSFPKALAAFNDRNWKAFVDALSPARLIANWGIGKITVKNGNIYYKGEQIHGSCVDKILEMIDEDIDVEYLLRFINKLYKNPSRQSVDEAFDFLKSNNFVITADGDILAYRTVRDDFRDKHSGTFDNSPGKTCTMPREKVDNNRNMTCSTGLICSPFM